MACQNFEFKKATNLLPMLYVVTQQTVLIYDRKIL